MRYPQADAVNGFPKLNDGQYGVKCYLPFPAGFQRCGLMESGPYAA
jgi:hypothetical protein